MLPEKLEEIIEVVRLKISGVDVPYQAAEKPVEQRRQGVAVLPLFGMITKRANMFTKISGATTTEGFIGAFRQLRADPEVGAIIIDADSPGGGVFGVPEAASEIFASRGVKKIVTVANSFAASAAYWIGAAADEFVVTPSGKAGSIGVFGVYEDRSSLEGKDGITHRIFSAGRYKTEGNPYEPLTDEAATHMQSEVNRYYDMFVADVARYRSVQVNQIRNGFGQGRAVGAKEAVAEGMADRVATLDETIARLLRELRSPGAQRLNAADERRRMAYSSASFPGLSAADRARASRFLAPEGKSAVIDDEIRRSRLRYA